MVLTSSDCSLPNMNVIFGHFKIQKKGPDLTRTGTKSSELEVLTATVGCVALQKWRCFVLSPGIVGEADSPRSAANGALQSRL